MGAEGQGARAEREAEIQRVVNDFLARRSSGELVSDSVVVARHPHLAPELARQLRLASIVESARAKANSTGGVETPRNGDPTLPADRPVVPGPNESRALIGRFELVERLGQGGFATVWKAHDPHLDRWVAVKIPRNTDLSASEAELFLREARSASQVRHPNVVHLHEVGRDGDVIYLVSDLIDGQPLHEWSAGRVLTHRQTAKLCETICRGLCAIHESEIVHRDLKPANIIIDGSDNPFITDFGLARRGGAEATMTLDGQLIGTPAYMSPEQASGESNKAGVASDLYSFGVIMYELLTGGPPFRGPPHRIFAQTIADVPPAPRAIDPSIPRDLETICLRCLEKEPNRRFASATELADELRRFLGGETIHSRPAGVMRRTVRWACRKPFQAAFVAAIGLLAVGGPAVAVREIRHARLEANLRQEAEVQRANANNRAIDAESRRREADAARKDAEAAQLEASAAALRARRYHYASDMLLVQNALERDDMLRAQQLLSRHFPQNGQADLRGFEWYHFWRRVHTGLRANAKFDGDGDGGGKLLAISPDGQYAATDHSYQWIAIVNLQTKRTIANVEAGFTVTGLWIDSQQHRLFAVGNQGQFRWWDKWDDPSSHTLEAHKGPVNMLVHLPDRSGFATCGEDGLIKFWSDQPSEPTRVLPLPEGLACRAIAFSPDGKSLAAVGKTSGSDDPDSLLLVLDGHSGDLRWSKHLWADERLVLYLSSRLAFSPDSKQLAYSRASTKFTLLSASDGEVLSEFQPRTPGMVWIGYYPDGSKLAGLNWEGGHVYSWDTQTHDLLESAMPHQQVRNAHWREDGTLVTSGPHRLCLWNPDSSSSRESYSIDDIAGRNDYVLTAARSVDRARLIVSSHDPLVTLWDVSTGKHIHTFWHDHRHPLLLPDGGTIISRSPRNLIRQSIGDAEPTTIYQHGDLSTEITNHAVSPDGRTAAIVAMRSDWEDGTTEVGVLLWDIDQQEIVDEFAASQFPVSQITFSPNGRYVIYVNYVGKIRCWDTHEHELLWESAVAYARHSCVACTDDGKLLALGGPNGSVELVDMRTGRLIRSFGNHGFPVNDIAFSPEGSRVVVGYGAMGTHVGEICLWDSSTGQMTARLGQELEPVVGVCFSRDGQSLMSVHGDGMVFLWKSATPAEVELQRWQP